MPFDTSSLWYLIPVCFLAAFSRSTFGFGDALIAMPLLNLAFELKDILPLVAMLSFFVAFGILLRDKRSFRWKSVAILAPFALLGVPVGLVLVEYLPGWIVQIVLGVIIVAFCAQQLTKPSMLFLKTDKLAPIFGFGAGILGGAYNTQGPLLVVYSALRRWTPEEFRATMQGFFLPTSTTILVGHYFAGRFTMTTVVMFAWTLPVVLIAIPMGTISLKYLDAKKFRFGLNLFLLAAGIALLIKALL